MNPRWYSTNPRCYLMRSGPEGWYRRSPSAQSAGLYRLGCPYWRIPIHHHHPSQRHHQTSPILRFPILHHYCLHLPTRYWCCLFLPLPIHGSCLLHPIRHHQTSRSQVARVRYCWSDPNQKTKRPAQESVVSRSSQIQIRVQMQYQRSCPCSLDRNW